MKIKQVFQLPEHFIGLLRDVLKITDTSPKWVDDWLDGESIFFDLSICSKKVNC